MGIYGHLTNLWYYNNTKEENVDKSHLEYLGELTRVKVLKTEKELDMVHRWLCVFKVVARLPGKSGGHCG